MKKKALALLLALAFCIGLMLPVSAAGTDGLDANEAKAFYNTLAEYGSQSVYVAFADLRDMDGDKIPEMIVVTVPKENEAMYQDATVDIWRMKDGTAEKTYSAEFGASQNNNMYYVTQNGKLYVCVWMGFLRQGVYGNSYDYIGANGLHESLYMGGDYNTDEEEYHRILEGTSTDITKKDFENYRSMYKNEGTEFANWGGITWYMDENHHDSYHQVLNQLSAKANSTPAPAAGTFGPYTITGKVNYDSENYSTFVISFSAAKVEKTTVQLRTKWVISGKETPEPYKNINVTLVTLKPESKISVHASFEEILGVQTSLIQEEPRKYSYVPAATEIGGDDFSMNMLCTDSTSMKSALASGPVSIAVDDGETYIIAYEATSSSGFTDVKSDAYYAEAVKWAVDKKIASGTTASTFSPNSTCTVAQILTFLWRANGSPAASGRNPFSDVPEDSYYYKAALWANSKSLVSGGRLNPNAPCTRAMAVTYLWKLAGNPSAKGSSSFTDVPASAAYAKAVSWAVKQGITSGATAAAFNPNGVCTRGQIVTFLYRAMK